MHECPLCGGLPSLLGRLGKLVWFRCRSCHHEFSVTEDVLAEIEGRSE